MKFFKTHSLLLIALILLVVLTGAVAYYYYNQYQNAQALLKNPNAITQKQTQQLVNQVGQLMDLPKDETPTVATVTDATKLKNQPFFANAKDGDKVLIYVKARKAILYDPTANKIVDVAPVNLAQQPVNVTPTVSQSPVYIPPASNAASPAVHQ